MAGFVLAAIAGEARAAPSGDAASPTVPSTPQAEISAPPSVPAAIFVAPSRAGVVISSEDRQALDQFESLLRTLGGSPTDTRDASGELTVFYLKHAKAEDLTETCRTVLAAVSRSGALVRITPEPRLNALIVQASPEEVEAMSQLLKVLDQKHGPEEVLAQPKPRVIGLHHAMAEDVADVIRQVYQDRLTGAGQGGPQQGAGPSPEFLQRPMGMSPEFFQQMAMLQAGRSQAEMARGETPRAGMPQAGMNRRGGRQPAPAEERPKLSIGVDARSNSLVVAAPDALFREVKDLVAQLDRAPSKNEGETVQVVALHGASAELLRQSLPALAGQRVHVGETMLTAMRPGMPGMPGRGRLGQTANTQGTSPTGTSPGEGGQGQPSQGQTLQAGAAPNPVTTPATPQGAVAQPSSRGAGGPAFGPRPMFQNGAPGQPSLPGSPVPGQGFGSRPGPNGPGLR